MSTNVAGESRYNVRIPSLFEIFFGKFANWFRQLNQWRKQGLLKKALQAARRRRAMRLETLEPRVLLSADALGALDLGQHDSFDDIALLYPLDGNIDQAPYSPAEDASVLTAADVGSVDLSMSDVQASEPAAPINEVGEITLTVDSSSEAIFGVGQVVFLSFDGAADVDYEGPIVISDVD